MLVEVTLGVLSFLFFTPSYLIIFNIYALCRIDDISWGTKGRDEDKQGENKMKEKWRIIKIVYVLKYIFWNTTVSTFFLHIEYNYEIRIITTLGIMSLVLFILLFKCFLGLTYLILYKAKKCNGPKLFMRDDLPIPSLITDKLSD